MSTSTTLPNAAESNAPMVVGWREWVSLPELGILAIKAKVDTGARTSAIDAFDIERYQDANGADCIEFSVNPVQRDKTILRRCTASLMDIRSVTDSGGHTAERYFIQTTLKIGESTRTIELTLAHRKEMLFRMLLGRTSLIPNIVVNPQLSYTAGRLNARALYAAASQDSLK